MLGAFPTGTADVRQARRARGVWTALALRAAGLAQDQAGLGLAQVDDLERRIVVDHELLTAESTAGIGLGDAEDRVVGVAIRAGMLVFAGLIEDRVDLAPEGRKAQGAGGGSGERRL